MGLSFLFGVGNGATQNLCKLPKAALVSIRPVQLASEQREAVQCPLARTNTKAMAENYWLTYSEQLAIEFVDISPCPRVSKVEWIEFFHKNRQNS